MFLFTFLTSKVLGHCDASTVLDIKILSDFVQIYKRKFTELCKLL